MDAVEVKKTDGGFIIGLLLGIAIAELLDRNAGQDFKDGWNAAN